MSLKVAIHDHECFPTISDNIFFSLIFGLFHFSLPTDDIFKVPTLPWKSEPSPQFIPTRFNIHMYFNF